MPEGIAAKVSARKDSRSSSPVAIGNAMLHEHGRRAAYFLSGTTGPFGVWKYCQTDCRIQKPTLPAPPVILPGVNLAVALLPSHFIMRNLLLHNKLRFHWLRPSAGTDFAWWLGEASRVRRNRIKTDLRKKRIVVALPRRESCLFAPMDRHRC